MKLNIKQDGYYSIEERITLVNGKFEGNLKHDNVNQNNIIIFTQPNMQGDIIDNFNIYTNNDKPWETYIRVFSPHKTLYVNYQTKGDTVDADDINKLTKDLIGKLDAKEFEQLKQEVELVNKVLNGKADESEILRLEEMIKDIVEGDDHEYIIPRVTISPIMNELYYQRKTLDKPQVSWRGDDWGSWDVSDISHLKLDDERYYATTYCNILENDGSITLKFRKNDRGPHILRQKRNGKNIVDTGHIRDKEKEHTLYVKKGDQISIMASFVGDVYVDYKGEDSDLRLSVYKNGKVEEIANKRLVEERLEDFTHKDEFISKVGVLDDLATDEKDNIVAAINSLINIIEANKSYVDGQLKSKSNIGHKHVDYEDDINTLRGQLNNLDIPEGVDLTPVYEALEDKAHKDNVVISINDKKGNVSLTTDDIPTTFANQFVSSSDKLKWNSVIYKANEEDLKELESKLSQPFTWGDLKGGI